MIEQDGNINFIKIEHIVISKHNVILSRKCTKLSTYIWSLTRVSPVSIKEG